MTLWWAKREQLDEHQINLIENLDLNENHLVVGPPGSGKTNVLLRRAQFVHSQEMPNVMVLTYTRPLTEFVKTGCFDAQGREIFNQECVSTLESWIRSLYRTHGEDLPEHCKDLVEWKKRLANGALGFKDSEFLPQYETLFVDEAQDLLAEEICLLRQWSPVLFFVGDDRQRIYNHADGLNTLRNVISDLNEHCLPFHYRLAPEICSMADRILRPVSGSNLSDTSQYNGPKPATIFIADSPTSEINQMSITATKVKDQIRVYSNFIQQGDRIGIIVAKIDDRDKVFEFFENDPILSGKSKIIRARTEGDDFYDPSFDDDRPVCIVSVQGCKGLEFRAVHWLFCDQNSYWHTPEHYYTVVTRAKTALDIYYNTNLPHELARSYSNPTRKMW